MVESLVLKNPSSRRDIDSPGTQPSANAKSRLRKLTVVQHWKEDVRCVFQRDPAARSTVEVVATYPGVQAVAMHRISHALWRNGWRFLPRFLAFLSRLVTNVDIHPGAFIGRRFFIDHGACVVIGETAVIGDDVTLYHGVTLGGTSWNKGRRHPQLGNGVMIGAGAKVLGAISLGENVRVGANSVIVEPVPANSTVVGIPGKVVVGKKQANLHPEDRQNTPADGIDLNHHLIPDPVGKAIACLLDRLDALEKTVQQQGIVAADYQKTLFSHCDPDSQICEKDCAGGVALNQGTH